MDSRQTSYQRYIRQIQLSEFGLQAQKKLELAKVLVVGAGGLSCASLPYLVAAGVGTIGIIDDDIIRLENLHRQILYSTSDIGKSKAETAALKLQDLNPDIRILHYKARLDTHNAIELINEYDLVVDGTDNFASRYLINDACVLLNKPFIYAAVSKFESQVAVFNVQAKVRSVNYRDLFPVPPKEHEIRNCELAGVLGVLPGITGVMQANETIKLITGIGTVLNNKLLNYNALTNQFYDIQLQPNEDSQSRIPRSIEAFEATNYEFLCSSEYHDFEIDTNQFKKFITDKSCCILDIREHGELPEVDTILHRKIPLSQFSKTNFEIPEQSIVVFCQSGQRSILAVKFLNELFIDSPKNIYSLKGGINKWLELNS